MEKGQLVPDIIINNLVLSRLHEPDVLEKGYVLEGYPRNRQQALCMQQKGIIPDHSSKLYMILNLVIFDVPDHVILERVIGLRYDPATNRVYHMKYDPPPKNSTVESRLVRKASDSEQATSIRLNVYRKNIAGILDTWKIKSNILSYPEGIMGNEQAVYKDVFNVLGRKPVSRAPRSYKIILVGLPGSGKSKIAHLLHQKYEFVHGIFLIS